MNARYAVTITYPDGHIVRATVNAVTLKGFRLAACRDCAINIVKVQT